MVIKYCPFSHKCACDVQPIWCVNRDRFRNEHYGWRRNRRKEQDWCYCCLVTEEIDDRNTLVTETDSWGRGRFAGTVDGFRGEVVYVL